MVNPAKSLVLLSSSIMASTVELPSGQDQSKSKSSSYRSVTGNPELDNWIRIIEYFAKFKTELWMLHDVFEMGPKQLPENLGEDTNEMVAFRCLASLFDSDVSASESKIEFDSSLSCQHVLQCILDEIPLSELKPGAPGLSKWNVLPFIKSKLLCLPKCALELMIETSNEEDEDDDEVSPSCQEEEGMRDDQVTSPIDGANETSRPQGSVENGSDGDVLSPSERRYRCIQCKESGKLLFCSRDGCTVMVHEKCVVDSPPVYDDAGNFYCSLCALSCVSDEYLQSQEEVAKAKKKLVSFLSVMSKVNEKKSH